MSSILQTRIGILGAGQLGTMLVQAGIDLCLDIHCLDADPASPAARYAPFIQGTLTDEAAVLAFGADKDLITVEIENVSVPALRALEAAGKQVYPQPGVLEIIQDKLAQKRFYEQHGLPTAPYQVVQGQADVAQAAADGYLPAYQKLARGGYDGRGVQYLPNAAALPQALDGPGYLEQPATGAVEICILVARSATGETAYYPAVESVYYPEANMVDYLLCPARVPDAQAAQAAALAVSVAEAFSIVGLLAVELFAFPDGTLWVNECAPRPHNTGHHTIEACQTSQFAQHWRAVLGMPLGSTALRVPCAAMVNLVGAPGHQGPAHYAGLEQTLAHPGTYVHLYGKAQTRPYRKMGHITLLGDTLAALAARVEDVKAEVSVVSR